ncbi:sigma-70 family RNA polymerase sigma factor [bacterium]|nr:sigma-70 family RNA polymerase sigma factor [bacterium]
MTPTAARPARLRPPPDPRPDGALLGAFLTDRDEAAFAELVRRHGPLVLAACRRLLPDPTDAEDAFQAAFLVLVRRARRLTSSPALGPWLYRVAAWTARNVRRRNARRLARTAPLPDAVPAPPTSLVPALDLDAALLALPEKYRTPLVLCHLQGWSRRDAAARLGCPEGTLSALLARGLVKLRGRLGGYDPAAVLAVGLTAVPPALSASTVTAATATRAAVAPAVAELADGVLRMFWVQKATVAAAGLAVVFALGAGVGLSVREAPAVAQVPAAPAPKPAAGPESEELKAMRAELTRAKDRLDEEERERAALAVTIDRLREKLVQAERQVPVPPEAQVYGAMLAEAEERQFARSAVIRGREELIETYAAEIAVVERVDGAELSGLLAVEVIFPTAERYKLAVAGVDLARAGRAARDRVPAAAWDAARRGCHVLARFSKRQPCVPVAGSPDLVVAELLLPLPLTRDPGGFVLARDGDRVVRFSNYPNDARVRFQTQLLRTTPTAR